MIYRIFLFLLFLSYSMTAKAHKEDFYFLYGKLGERTVALKIEAYEETWFAKYYFLDSKKDIFLRGKCDSTDCIFYRTEWDSKKKKEIIIEAFKIRERPDHNWEGEWKSGKKKRRILLFRINKDTISHNFSHLSFVKDLDPFSYLRSSDVKFEKTASPQEVGGFDWYTEPVSGISLFRFREFSDSLRCSFGNNFLDSVQLREFENYCTCTSFTFPGEYNIEADVSFIGKGICSFRLKVIQNCQGNHKTEEIRYITCSVVSGRKLGLEDLLWLGKGPRPVPESAEWYEYRYKVFAPHIAVFIDSIYGSKLSQNPGPCDYLDEKAWQFPHWEFSDSGLRLGALFPGIDRSCDKDGWFIIPYPFLEKWLDTKSFSYIGR